MLMLYCMDQLKLHKEAMTDTIWYCSLGPGSLVVILQSAMVKIPLQWNFTTVNVVVDLPLYYLWGGISAFIEYNQEIKYNSF